MKLISCIDELESINSVCIYHDIKKKIINGLRTASELRKRKFIERFIIRFVVSKRNYLNMPQFFQLGIVMGCDIADFSKIENWGTFSDEEFEEISMFKGNQPKPELRRILALRL